MIVALVGLLSLGPVADHADANGEYLASSQRLIEGLAEKSIKALTADDLAAQDRRDRFRAILSENFAVAGIARFALGRHWRGASDDERDEYVELFRELIVATWADRFREYAGQTFEVQTADEVEVAGDEKVALVRSVFFTDPDTPVRIEWRVGTNGEIYRITDVVIEGVSMAHTYRDEFASVLRKDGLAGLLDSLRSRSESSA